MRMSGLAERYAKALFESLDGQKVEGIGALLRELSVAFRSSPEILEFARSPLIKTSEKKAAITAAFQSIKLGEVEGNFLSLLAENDRLYLIPDIAFAFQELLDEQTGVTRGHAKSAQKLSEAERAEIVRVMGQLTGKKVILDFEVEPNLIGSVVAQVGSLTIDDSLKAHLSRLEDDLNRRVH